MRQFKIVLFEDYVTKNEKKFFFLVALIWAHYPLLHFFEALLTRIFGAVITPILFILLWSVAIIGGLREIQKRMNGFSALVILVLAITYVLNYGLYPQNTSALNYNAGQFFLSALPCFIVGVTFKINKGRRLLYYISLLCIFAQYLFSFVYGNNRILAESGEGGDQLAAAYLLLPHVLMTSSFFIRKPGWISGISTMLGTILLVSFGSRGPFLCLMFFVVCALFYSMRQNHSGLRKYVYLFLISVPLLFFINNFWQEMMESVISSQNMSDRLVVKFAENNFLESNDRDELKTMLFRELKKEPLLGYGVAGDRNFVGALQGGYAHNIIVEILFSFGYLMGGAILLIIAKMIMQGIKYLQGDDKYFFLVLFFCGFVGLLFSGSYLTSRWFFFLMGVCMASKNDFFTNKRVYKEYI